MEQHRRSIAKAASYRLFATTIVFGAAFLYTGHFGAAAKIGVSAALAKTTLYSFWERLWANFSWGRDGHSPGVTDMGGAAGRGEA